IARRRGRWDRSDLFLRQAERLDPRNARLLTEQAFSYIHLRRFTEAKKKLDQVLNIAPDDIDTIAIKGAVAQAEGALAHAAVILAPLHPTANNTFVLEKQAYQAILERNAASIIPKLEQIIAQPDPTLGYFNGELRFWLGWAQEVAGEHVAARETWQKARSELERFLTEQPENHFLIGDLALINMGLGDKI